MPLLTLGGMTANYKGWHLGASRSPNNRSPGGAVMVGEGGGNMTLSRKMIWLGGGLVALAILIVALVLVYAGGGSSGGY